MRGSAQSGYNDRIEAELQSVAEEKRWIISFDSGHYHIASINKSVNSGHYDIAFINNSVNSVHYHIASINNSVNRGHYDIVSITGG